MAQHRIIGGCIVFVLLTVVLVASATVLLVNTNGATLTAIGANISVAVPHLAQRVGRHAWLHRDGLRSHLYVARLERNLNTEGISELEQTDLPCCENLPFIPPKASPFVIRGAPDTGFTSAIIDAASDWNTALGSKAVFGTITQDALVPAFVEDGVNEVSLGNLQFSKSANVLAVTVVHFNSATGIVSEWDQCFNSALVSYGDVPQDTGVHDRKTVGLHEFGHVVALGDLFSSECSTTLMSGTLPQDTVRDIDKMTLDCALGVSGSICSVGRPSLACQIVMALLVLVSLAEL